jgi:hypothetical protein
MASAINASTIASQLSYTIDSSGSSTFASIVDDITTSPVLPGIVRNDNFEANLTLRCLSLLITNYI